jgi:nickel/cobalt exporter
MSAALFFSIVGAGFIVAFLHAALPTHWLPFALAARGQGWRLGKALGVTALAGVGHAVFTTALGGLVVTAGYQLNARANTLFHVLAGGALVAFGLYYLVRQLRGGGGGHVHLFHGYGHEHAHSASHAHAHGEAHHDDETLAEAVSAPPPPRRSDRAAILSLMALLTFSPCESFLPVFLAGARYGLAGFAVLGLTLAIATIAGMLVFTSLSMAGLTRLRINTLERYEGAILGLMLCLLGGAIFVLD